MRSRQLNFATPLVLVRHAMALTCLPHAPMDPCTAGLVLEGATFSCRTENGVLYE